MEKTNKNIENFLNNLNSELKTLANWVVARAESTGKNIDDIINLPEEELKCALMEMNPSNVKMITNFVYILNLYAKFVENKSAVEILTNLDRKEIWENISKSGNVKRRFISKEDFNELISNIELFEEFNPTYYTSLLSCIYHGIYNEDLSVITNLSGSDIDVDTGKIYLRSDDNDEYDIYVPISLAEDLIELSRTFVWQRKNRYGLMEIQIEGKKPDSCFKIENRGGNSYKYAYFAKIRKAFNDYADYNVKPMNLYVSGIMGRIKDTLQAEGYTLEYAFKEHKRTLSDIIQAELDRSHYTQKGNTFRQMINGHLDEF